MEERCTAWHPLQAAERHGLPLAALLMPHSFVGKPTEAQHEVEAVTVKRPFNAPPEAIHIPGLKNPKYAFATLLIGTEENADPKDDKYLVAARILTYQLLHCNETRTQDPNIPFVILVTDRVPEPARQRLRQDGAIVVEIPFLYEDWVTPMQDRWKWLMTKLRMWELVDFEKIIYLDADTVLSGPLDHMFEHPIAALQPTLPESFNSPGSVEALPETYLYAGVEDWTWGIPKAGPNDPPLPGNFNAGFILEYYVSLLRTPDSFDSRICEQSLLNAVHRQSGAMPWKRVDFLLSSMSPTWEEAQQGIVAVHEKWWLGDPGLNAWMVSWRWRMEGFYEAFDTAKKYGRID